ncbi:hypothetical protein [Actinomadura sp. 3N407]|uniref:hypothetical protein n=1 Tax=Actinomadura sp. 3N407 TaxID=3457423 RepID=UPI003FCDF599
MTGRRRRADRHACVRCCASSTDGAGRVSHLAHAAALTVLKAAPGPRQAAKLTPALVTVLWHRAPRRNEPGLAERISTTDYETLASSAEAMIHIAVIDNASKCITGETTPTWRGIY